MRTPRVSGMLGAGVAVAVFGAVMVAPRPLAADPREEGGGLCACAGDACEPGPVGLVARVDAQIGQRMPALAAADRRQLARTIVGEAELARIDPLLVLALIEVESGYDARALSGAGARGLMQLTEPTLRREVERAGLALTDPHDPIVNVQAGVRYLRRLLDAFPAEEDALMAYNAGPNAMLAYFERGEVPEPIRAYPRRIQSELNRLRRRLGVVDRAQVIAAARARPVDRRPVAAAAVAQ